MQMCQSCGLPLKKETDYGKEKDGSLNTEYCYLCYGEGDFYFKGDLNQFKTMLKKSMAEKKLSPFLVFITMLMLPSLKRWKKISHI